MNNLTRVICDLAADRYHIEFIGGIHYALGRGMLVTVSKAIYSASSFISDDEISEEKIMSEIAKCKLDILVLMEANE